MPVTLDAVAEMLRGADLHPFSDGDGTLLLLISKDDQMLTLLVELLEDGEYLRWFIPHFLALPSGATREATMLRLLQCNRELKLLKFGVDPASGEVSIELDLHIEDSELTEAQVYRMLYSFYDVALAERSRLQQLIETGVYPGQDQTTIDDAVRRLLDGAGEPDDAGAIDPVTDSSPASASDDTME